MGATGFAHLNNVNVQCSRRQRFRMPIIMCGLGAGGRGERRREIDVPAAGSIPQWQLHLSLHFNVSPNEMY